MGMQYKGEYHRKHLKKHHNVTLEEKEELYNQFRFRENVHELGMVTVRHDWKAERVQKHHQKLFKGLEEQEEVVL